MKKKPIHQSRWLYSQYKKFRKLGSHIHSLMRSGNFFELSFAEQNRLLRKLKILYSRLHRVLGKQKLKWATAALTLLLSATVARADFSDPVRLSGFTTGTWASATRADVDGDGDMDIIIGNEVGLSHIENIDGEYKAVPDTLSPIDTLFVGEYPHPAFADLDGDGDLDLAVGKNTGGILFFEKTESGYIEQTGSDNPFNGIDIGDYAMPVFVDLDEDGDNDLVVGEYGYDIAYFENAGGTFVELTGASNPFDVVDKPVTVPYLTDYDEDGDLDLFVGDKYGSISYFENDGGTFTEQTGSDNPFDGLDFGDVASPMVFDVDGDGDMDLTITTASSNIMLFVENEGDSFTERRGTPNPFEGIITAGYFQPDFADYDEDGDMDIIGGNGNGNVSFWENTPDGMIPVLGEDNPFFGITDDAMIAPAVGDVDGDGDMDLLLGDYYGSIRFFENEEGNYMEKIDDANPFDTVNVEYYASPELVDFDADGDLDLFVGGKYGDIKFYENVAGTFVEQPGIENPFDGLEFEANASPGLGDLDGDGDLDLFVGDKYGSISYFENDGGTFVPMTDGDNPFDGMNFLRFASPEAADLDGDGDMDLYIGNNEGDLFFVENTASTGPNAIDSPLTQSVGDAGIDIYAHGRTILLESKFMIDNVEVYSISGKLIYSEKVQQTGTFEFRLDNASGMMIVRSFGEKGVATEKVLIK